MSLHIVITSDSETQVKKRTNKIKAMPLDIKKKSYSTFVSVGPYDDLKSDTVNRRDWPIMRMNGNCRAQQKTGTQMAAQR